MAPQMDMNHPENASSVPSDEKKHEHEQDNEQDHDNDNEQDHDNDNDNNEPAPASRLDGIAQQATAAEPTATTIPKPTPSSFSSSSSSSEENTEKRCVGSISFDETSIIKQLSKSQSKSKNEAEIGDETESVESESDASPIESESHPDGADEDEDEDADADADATPTTTPAAASSPLAVDTSAAPCLEPEGTTPVVRDASRRFSAEMLRQVLEDSGNEQEHETAATTAEAAATGAGTATGTGTSTGLTSTATSTSTSIPMDGTEDNGNESDPTAEEEVSSRDNSDTEDIEGKTSKKKPKEPPGSPAKRRRSYSESASERERRVSEKENKPSSSLFQQRNVGASIDENETGDIDEKMGDEQEQEQSLLSREPAGTLTSPIMFDNNDDRPEPTTMIQAKVEAEAETETETIAKNTPERELGQPIMQSSPQSRLTPNSLSPDFFLGDHDQDNIRIPTLPPLVVPRVGSTASYDSTSSMRQSRQLHPNINNNNNNNNGYHQQPLTTLSSFHSIQQQQQQQQHYKQQQQQQQSGLSIPNQVATMPGGKRKIHLHLWEDISSLSNNSHQPARRSSFLSFRRKKGILRKNLIEGSPIFERGSGFGGGGSSSNDGNDNANGGSGSGSSNNDHWANRGILTVSWYEGTTSVELQEHVQNSVVRKLGLKSTSKLLDFRVLDESSNPPEEIVLSPYIPDGSRLTVRFATATYDGNDDGNLTPPKYTRFSDFDNGPPDSPSAAPSPYPTSLDLNGLGLNANQLALLGTRLNSLQVQVPSSSADSKNRDKLGLKKQNGRNKSSSSKSTTQKSKQEKKSNNKDPNNKEPSSSSSDDDADDDNHSKESSLEVASLHPEDAIQKSLRDITSLLLQERAGRGQHYGPRQPPQQEKRQVVFVLANYFVLFLSLIAISAEIQARAPGWHAAMEQQLMNVQDCSKDKESLFQCVESGDMAGLVASVVLWMSRSAATKRIFLFGFSSPNKLWTAVYESLVTSICWGFSYMFIRRGMNPDNNRDFLRRYWKDAVYGSLAGFNAAFMKQVLKNLIPQEVIEDALQERQLKILSWLPSLKQREN